jgi:hypothetical protein
VTLAKQVQIAAHPNYAFVAQPAHAPTAAVPIMLPLSHAVQAQGDGSESRESLGGYANDELTLVGSANHIRNKILMMIDQLQVL